MRALLVLLSVYLLTGCATPASTSSCANRGMTYMAATGQCIPSTTTNLGSAYRSHISDAHIPAPIIDRKAVGFDAAKYSTDLGECRRYANQVASQTMDNALGGALLGAMFGAIVDSSLDTSGGARTGAMSGALGGGVRGAANTHQGRALVLRRCLAGRGYSVLNM